MKKKRSPKLYIEDIKDSIHKIECYTQKLDFKKFIKSNMTMDAVIRNLSIIGEAAKNIPQNVKNRHREIPWYEIIGMRNKVIHEYFGVNEEVLWKTIKEDIPLMKKRIKRLK